MSLCEAVSCVQGKHADDGYALNNRFAESPNDGIEGKMNTRDFLEILHIAERLKDTTRHCTTSKRRIESVAEHSWRMSLMAYLLKHEFPDVDIDRVVDMCLIHDLGECFTGDIPTFMKTEADRETEGSLLRQWVLSLPQELSADLSGLYEEMDNQILIVKSHVKEIDDLAEKLFDKTVNSIQRVSRIDSDEWGMLENYISNSDKQIRKIVEEDKRISDYYESEEFEKIMETSSLLTQSQREFNTYIREKTQSITKLFGIRVARNATQNEDVYNYIRPYKKSITPFTAEVSATVFGSAENNPIPYVVKYFYPYRSQYKEQIAKLRVLIEELETLNEARRAVWMERENPL